MGKLLFYDIDGTLLSDRTYVVPESAIEAIKKAKEKGHQCFLSTGRSYGMTHEVSVAGISDAVIANGTAIVMNGQPVVQHAIDKDVVVKTLKKVDDLKGGYQIIDWNYGYQNPVNYEKSTNDFLARFPETDPKVFFDQKGMKALSEYKGDYSDILKIDVFFNSHEDAVEFENELDTSLEITWAGGYTNNTANAGEITLKGIDKGVGIKDLCEYLNKDIKETFGFGDSTNDLAMLETVGTAVVMGNAPDKVKEYGDYITDDIDEDGLANAMKHFDLV